MDNRLQSATENYGVVALGEGRAGEYPGGGGECTTELPLEQKNLTVRDAFVFQVFIKDGLLKAEQ